eukprot:ANDGO_00298.mRNA.1 Glycerate kinase
MHVLLACDKFKGTATAKQVNEAIQKGLQRRAATDARMTFDRVSMSDGGDGFVSAFQELFPGDSTVVPVIVTGPLGTDIQSHYLSVTGSENQKIAIVESALANGLFMVPNERQNPLHTTSCGVGQLIRHAYSTGHSRIVVGLGGSSTSEGGLSVLQGLGADIELERDGQPLNFRHITGEHLLYFKNAYFRDPQLVEMLETVQLDIASDVSSPYVGPNGAVSVFAPQKGAKTPEMLSTLEKGMERVACWLDRKFGKDVSHMAGSGAAGGISGMLACVFRHASVKRGVDIVIGMAKLEERIADADIVFTGEGSVDAQSSAAMGKVVGRIVELCQSLGKPVYIVCGVATGDVPIHCASMLQITESASLEDCLADPERIITELVASTHKITIHQCPQSFIRMQSAIGMLK